MLPFKEHNATWMKTKYFKETTTKRQAITLWKDSHCENLIKNIPKSDTFSEHVHFIDNRIR